MRQALADRDIAAVFRLLQRHGVSQRRLAAATGQSQSEISEILRGRRVVSYDVLLRIAQGLSVPRGWLGLAYDDATAPLVGIGVMEGCRSLARLLDMLTPPNPVAQGTHCGTTDAGGSAAGNTQPAAS